MGCNCGRGSRDSTGSTRTALNPGLYWNGPEPEEPVEPATPTDENAGNGDQDDE